MPDLGWSGVGGNRSSLDSLRRAIGNDPRRDAINYWALELDQRGDLEHWSVLIALGAARDPASTFWLAVNYPELPDRETMVGIALASFLAADPLAGEAALRRTSPEFSGSRHLLDLVAKNRLQIGISDLDGWLNQWEEASERQELSRAFVDAWARLNPGAAAEWLAQPMHGQERDPIADATLIKHWIKEEAGDALLWTFEHLTDQRRKEVLSHAVGTWAAQKPDEAGNFLNGMDGFPGSAFSSEERDALFAAYVVAVAIEEPSVAETWVDGILEEELRDNARLQVSRVREALGVN
ncbi:MAG: hypothetical protein ACFCU4_05600 [Puniceicoccaceae bacterium]